MKTCLTILTSLFIIISGCNKSIVQPDEEDFTGKLKITTDKSEYYPEDFNGDFAYVSATVVNTSTDTLYSGLGDFYGGIDQDVFFAAGNADGFFEVISETNSWTELPSPLLIEGNKVVRILPSKAYKLIATAFLDSSNFGRCRLGINYYKTRSKTDADTLKDVSNTFFIYK